ncbi:unnamed protein product, partial [Musa acuminata var. zebrina]
WPPRSVGGSWTPRHHQNRVRATFSLGFFFFNGNEARCDDTGFLVIPQSGGADPTVFSKAKAREVVIGRRLVDC